MKPSSSSSLMNISIASLLLLLLHIPSFPGHVQAATLSSSNQQTIVLPLTSETFKSTFDDNVDDDTLWLVKFYAPWCGHCKRLAPVLDKVVKQVHGKMNIAKVDCTVEKDVCREHSIRGYPTLKYYRNGEFHDYPGGRSENDFVFFSNRMNRHPVTAVSSLDEVHSIAESTFDADRICFVAYDGKSKGTNLEEVIASSSFLTEYKKVARGMQADSGNFSLIMPEKVSAESLKEFGISPKTTQFVAKIEKGVPPSIYSSSKSTDLKSFIKDNNMGLITQLSSRNFPKLAESGKLLALLVIDTKYGLDGESMLVMNNLKRTALSLDEETKGKYLFGWVDGRKFSKFLSQYEMDSVSIELFVLDPANKLYFKNRSSKKIDDFLKAVLSGEIEGKKQKKPEKQNPVSQTFSVLKAAFDQFKPWSYIIFLPVILLIVQVVLGVKEGLAMRAKEKQRTARLKQD